MQGWSDSELTKSGGKSAIALEEKLRRLILLQSILVRVKEQPYQLT
ncbi:hypothetical protein H7992_04490 [Sporosarcina sp. resist]|nr:hypothetical protein H7992_04490 [Sporosarcina sp. resist]